MLEMWMELPAWLRVSSGLVFIATGGLIVWAGATGRIRGGRGTYTVAFGLIGAGVAMVVLGERSKSEKNGYHF